MSRGMASMDELQTIYSYEDMLIMAEIIQVNNYNEWCALEAVNGKGH